MIFKDRLPDPDSLDFKEVFTDFYGQSRPVVRAIALRIAGPAADIDGMANETFARLLATLKAGIDIKNPGGFVRVTVSRLAIDYHREARSDAISAETLPEISIWSSVSHLVGPEVAYEVMELHKAIDSVLSEPLRNTLLLREVAGLTVGEVADILDIGKASVATNVLRAKRKLRQHFEDQPIPAMTEYLKGGKA
ncbi:sigma-70 family RNA polymerase sigma factor [Streptomyces sp. NPDC004579]|uniref:RNA polymerase sigma factor n=1 Tax=Streptomyces sp. NPDC004579 TaxID=3154667 RepID=UPI0033A13F06